ncbi:MAG: tyrosine-type recombinase/integrase [Oscillospiraceae bacterium]|nr:tyrosine-type recombinase/integrase [Oscillospiraceae bacterium]
MPRLAELSENSNRNHNPDTVERHIQQYVQPCKTMALLLQERKARIDEIKEFLGDDYNDFDLVICHDNGTPIEHGRIRTKFQDLIKKANLKPVVFHSLRHSSTTYKLKVSGGDIKAVQGDTGHAEAAMITERYAHILDDDRRINAEKFEEMFYHNEVKDTGNGNNEELLALVKLALDHTEIVIVDLPSTPRNHYHFRRLFWRNRPIDLSA